ncbi:MAG: hypothetical protein HQ517_01830, partial [SAR324 cluster bacterium]|nr:hypothetical protein [SAR324 cluster bacterium]
MKLVIGSILILSFLACMSYASDAEDRALENQIKNSGGYRWGEATDVDLDNAKAQSKKYLCENIYVAITNKIKIKKTEDDLGYTDNTAVVTTSLSALNLQNLSYLTFKEKDMTRAIAYIDTASLSLSFEASKTNVRDRVKLAQQAESEGRIGDALKLLYWAYLLTHSYVGELSLGFDGIDIDDARLAISEKMNRITDGVNVRAEPCYRKANEVCSKLSFFYNGHSVQNLDFGYQCGDGDGYGYVEKGSSEIITLY